ncbi:MAG: redox-sensing transcriptional repressor Rex [Planctomycetia bacterium]|nr:redox-sensing transcriptional repressor Rex [Planctomycetia bacterium]
MPPYRRNLPIPSVQRLPSYLRLLTELRARGEQVVSCTRIAEEFGQLSVQVRKDLAITGVSGRPKVGYRVTDLIDAIEAFLGWNKPTLAFLVGAGNLGSAILNYAGFSAHGLKIIDVFDSNSALYGKIINNRQVRSFNELVERARYLKETEGIQIDMGVITVPARSAQKVADRLVGIGVRAIWNYAPVLLELPQNVVCENVKLSESFAVLTNRMKNREEHLAQEEKLAD